MTEFARMEEDLVQFKKQIAELQDALDKQTGLTQEAIAQKNAAETLVKADSDMQLQTLEAMVEKSRTEL